MFQTCFFCDLHNFVIFSVVFMFSVFMFSLAYVIFDFFEFQNVSRRENLFSAPPCRKRVSKALARPATAVGTAIGAHVSLKLMLAI